MKKKILILFLIGFILMISSQLYGWFDESLFNSGSSTFSVMKPNILIMMDNSGSMNTLIYHPDYDPANSYTDPADDVISKYSQYTIEYFKKGTYYDPHLGYSRYFPVSQFYLTRQYSGAPYYPLTSVNSDGVYEMDVTSYHPAASVINLFGEEDSGNQVRIGGDFLNFMLYTASTDQVDEWNHFSEFGTWDESDTTDVDDHRIERKVRMRVAREVMKGAVDEMFDDYDADPNPDKEYPRFGISRFNSDEGGTVIQSCDANANRNATKVLITGIEGTTWTPLSEAYAEVYAYFRNGGECSISDDKYFLSFDNSGAQQISASTPISNWCQLNFIIVVTDGEPTQDDQLRNLGEGTIFQIEDDFSAPWGDTDVVPPNDDDKLDLASSGTNYLDDLAYYAFNEDIWPDDMDTIKDDSRFDSHMKNRQFIYTYTIGFAIDNVLLKDTAANGGGEYYTAKDYESLAGAIRAAFASIDEKVRAYASFAAPKYSLTYGDRSGYVATFVPKATQSIWEGHLKSYKLDEEGNFPDLENPGSALEWDAGVILNERSTARVIYTIKSGSLVSFDSSSLNAADLGFTSGDTAVDDANRDKVIDFVIGNNGYGWILGDIFHFTPTVVGAPLKWKASFDTSYQLFFDELTEWVTIDEEEVLISKRPEVVYVGANDGMLHCFLVETGEELWAFIPPSFLTRLRDMVPEVPSTDGSTTGTHQYFIDGKAIAKDIKMANSGAWTDWKTVIIFGYGIGGESYCALDVTDPESMSFLWEFNDPSYSGFTEGKPIIARLQNDGTGAQFPAVLLSGGYDIDEEPATAPNLKGKGFFVLNAYSGDIVKKFLYSASDSESKVGSTYIHTNDDFIYCFAATPSALDYDNNGLTDYVYMTESGDYTGSSGQGGRIWKINLNGDPAGWDATNIYQADDGQTMWLPPTLGYDYDYNLWLFTGTGHRPQPNNVNNITGRFLGIIDNSLSSTLTSSSLTDVNSIWSGTQDPITSGFWFEYTEGSGETIFEPYPIFINSTIYFNTYVPTTTSTKVIDPCVQEGNQSIYSFKVRAGGGEITIEDPIVEAGKIQGSGLLSGGKYKIYKGSGVVGSTDVIDQETIDVESVFGSMTWEEKRR